VLYQVAVIVAALVAFIGLLSHVRAS